MKTAAALILYMGISLTVWGQSCDCPAAGTCGSCQGGLVTLTLRYNGNSAQTVTAADQLGIVFNGVVNANSTFTFSGSTVNEKFVGVNVTLTVAGLPAGTIPSGCGSVAVGNTYGNFTIIAATSKNGGPLCCNGGVIETTPPVISGCPTNMTVSVPANSCQAAGGWTEPTAIDNCTLVSFTSTKRPGDLLNLGPTTVTYTATDKYENKSTCTFKVTVVDDIKPVFSNCPANITVDAASNCRAFVTWTEPTATDNCSSVTMSRSFSPGSSFPLGTTVVPYTATDAAGNSSTCTFNVVVRDVSAPVITNCPLDITLETTNTCQVSASWMPPTITDNCSFTSSSSHLPGATFPVGTTLVTYTATDPSGNKAVCTFNVIVKTNQAPTLSNCPDDITLHTYDDSMIVSWDPPKGKAACGELVKTETHKPGDSFAVGVTKVTYEFRDDTNNRVRCSFNVTIIKDEVEFEVNKAVTPNGDGVNDTWELTNIENFKDNSVTLVDRWGNKIYQANGYNNSNVVWNGTGPNGSKVPKGTYFYTIEVRVKESRLRKTGFVEVVY